MTCEVPGRGLAQRLVDRCRRPSLARVAVATSVFEVGSPASGGSPSAARRGSSGPGLDDPAGGLARLAAALEEGSHPDFPPETRPYHPHLTLARSNPPLAVPPGWAETEVEPVAWSVDRLVLFESHLRRPHARYERSPRIRFPG